MSWTDLASQMGVSRVAVQNRARRLQAKGIILGYSVIIASESTSDDHSLHYFRIRLRRGFAVDALFDAIRERWPQCGYWPVNGQWDAIVQLAGAGLNQAEEFGNELALLSLVAAVSRESAFS